MTTRNKLSSTRSKGRSFKQQLSSKTLTTTAILETREEDNKTTDRRKDKDFKKNFIELDPVLKK